MRRNDGDFRGTYGVRNGAGGCPEAPPFTVLSTASGDRSHYLLSSRPPSPPPPRAPEPYKVGPATSAFNRAHRKSSFVIIAEARPSSPGTPRSPSPTLATGRVSPFRGRGFKGPLPRSRPQTPEELKDGRRRGRHDKRVSNSQQNSPKRSQIPRPARSRSVSLCKENDKDKDNKDRRVTSPKFGRRAVGRYTSSVVLPANAVNRRQSQKRVPGLSPIQGTPTKPEKTGPAATKTPRNVQIRRSPEKTGRTSLLPPKNLPNSKKTVAGTAKSASTELLGSPSKIPLTLRRGSISNIPDQVETSITKNKNKRNEKAGSNQALTAKKDEKAKADDKSKVDDKAKSGNPLKKKGQNTDTSTSTKLSAEDSSKNFIDTGLANILKQTSSATGASSVVNTATTTAVQPLHIDASALLVETAAKIEDLEKAQELVETTLPGSNTSEKLVDNKKSQVAKVMAEQDMGSPGQTSTKTTASAVTPGSNTVAVASPRIKTEDKNVTSGTHSKTNSIGQPAKMKPLAPNPSNSVKSTAEEEVDKGSVASVQPKDVQPSNTASVKTSEELSIADKTPDARSKASQDTSTVIEEIASPVVSNHQDETKHKKTESKVSVTKSSTGKSTNSTSSKRVSSANSADDADKKTMGSLQSAAGQSLESVVSVRSTAAALNETTTKGVSSPKETTGMHMVKPTEEIETLSGNIIETERNGDTVAPAAAENTKKGPLTRENLLNTWRSLRNRCKCCPGMRCLVFKKDPKGRLWPRNKLSKITKPTVAHITPVNTAPESTPQTHTPGRWAKIKDACRCTRMKELRCCLRRARISPAESTPCCPPERRLGALCRNLFSRCKCRRSDTQRNNQSIRAKHSLTSVAAPPLSEERRPKIPDVLVEHNSVMRGAIPCLPVPLAWFCLVWNVLLPGSGTFFSGLFNLCIGQPRFSTVATPKARFGAFIVNLIVGVSQLFTVLFCLVGWGWSIWWGVTMLRLARKYKRFRDSEAAAGDPEGRGGETAALPPGVPSQALRGIERAR